MAKRIFVYILGLLILGFGVAFAVSSDLGVSPVSSFPYVLSLIFEIDLGIVVTAVLLVYILLQAIILRREFKIINLTQILFSMLFGGFVDLGRAVLGDFRFPTYFGQLLMLCISMVLLAAGIICILRTKLILLPAEGLVDTIAGKIKGGAFHRVKIGMDSILVLLGLGLSLLFLGGVYGIREGTIIAAVFIGKIMPYVGRVIDPVIAGFLKMP